jgi:hypothetical protein
MSRFAMLWEAGASGPVLAQWQWGSAGMLAFGLATLIPILLHLWSRRPYRVQSWAAIRFLQAALQRTARRRQLATWLLLLFRCGLLGAWAVALAAPRWHSTAPAAALTAPAPHVCLVLDRSYSMQYRTDGGTRFQQALAQARAKVDGAAEGTAFTLVAMDQVPQAILAQPTLDRARVRAELERLQAGLRPASLSATLALVQRIVIETAQTREVPTPQEVCIYSDLQQLPWAELRAAGVQTLLASVQQHAAVELIDVGRGEAANRAIVQVACDPPLATVGQPVQLVAEVRNFGRENRLRQEVTIWIDQQPAGQQLIDLPAGSSVQVTLTHRFAQAGDRIVEFRLADDALPVDDRRWLCVPVRRTLRVLCLGSQSDDTRYLALALSPDPAAATGLEVVQRHTAALRPEEWQAYDCVILSNVAGLADLPGLWRYVREGGGLIVFLGDRVEPQRYAPAQALDPPLLPARLQPPVAEGNFRLQPRQEQHPIVAPFRGLPQSGLLTTPVWRYLPLTPLPHAVTVAQFDSGDPAIVVADVGRGRCVLVATSATWPTSSDGTSAETPWTALPTWPSFPPLVHEMVRYVLAAGVPPRQVLVGQRLEGTWAAPRKPQPKDRAGPDAAAGQVPGVGGDTLDAGHASPTPAAPCDVQIQGPGPLEWTLPAAASKDRSSQASPPLPQPGVYEVRCGQATMRYVANVDPAESDLARVDLAFLEGLLIHAPPATSAAAPAAARPQDLAWPLLALVLVMLVAEPYLAGWLAGRRP